MADSRHTGDILLDELAHLHGLRRSQAPRRLYGEPRHALATQLLQALLRQVALGTTRVTR